MSVNLIKYDAARTALADAHRVDEVKDIRDKAVAMQVYAKQAKDTELIDRATDIRMRAERRLGEIMEEERKAGRLATGKEGKRKALGSPKDPRDRPSLAEQGIGKALADRARKAAALPEGEFEVHVAQTVQGAVTSIEGKATRQAEKRRRRERERELELADKITALPDKRYGVIYADCPWHFEPYSAATGMDRAADNHYPTMDLEAIKALPIPAADNCALFLWATVPMLPQAIEVIAAWGFEYRSHCIWHKDKVGLGYWFRNRHELLLVGTRGNIPAPGQGEQAPSVIEAPRALHSEKPVAFAEMIERLYPNVPKLEMFARAPRAGWDVWGNEVGDAGHAGHAGHGNEVERITGNEVEARDGDNDDDPQDSADARKAAYAAVDESGMTADPRKDGIPLFLQTQNRGAA